MKNSHFFNTNKVPNKVRAGGPPPEAQLSALANNEYWMVLNSHFLKTCPKGTVLCERANAFKHALQTYGPISDALPDLRHNEGKAKNYVFHGHVQDGGGTTYELEWAIIDPNKRIMALIGFDTHENYPFRQKPLTDVEKEKILSTPENIKLMEHAEVKIEEAKNKLMRLAK